MANERLLGGKSYEFIGPPERLVFKAPDGRDSTVEIRGKRYIGHEAWGNIYRVQADVLSPEKPRRIRSFTAVLKSYDRQPDQIEHPSRARLSAKYSFRAFQEVRKAGVTTWTTYRLEAARAIILMSDAGEDNQTVSPSLELRPMAGSAWSVDKDSFLRSRVNDISNLEEALGNAIAEAQRAEVNGIRLPADAWFIRIRKKPNDAVNIAFFVGDFDSVSWGIENSTESGGRQNVSQLEEALKFFLREMVEAGATSLERFRQLEIRVKRTIDNTMKPWAEG